MGKHEAQMHVAKQKPEIIEKNHVKRDQEYSERIAAKHSRLERQKVKRNAPVRLPDLSGLKNKLYSLFRRIGRAGKPQEKRECPVYEFSLKNVTTVAVGALLFLAAAFAPVRPWLHLLIYFVPYFILGLDTLRDALGELLDRDYFGSDLLISLGSIGCFAIGQWKAAVFVMLLYRVFVLTCSYVTSEKASRGNALNILLPETVKVESSSGISEVELSAVNTGSVIVVEAGETIPLDGMVIDGISSLRLTALSGSERTSCVAAGSAVYAGSINLSNSLRIRVTEDSAASLASKASQMANQAAETQAHTFQFLRYAARLIPALFSIAAVVVGVVIPAFAGNWNTWLVRGVLLLCAAGNSSLFLSLSVLTCCAVSRASEEGAYFNTIDALDKLSRVKAMVFNKTGTVTEGRYTVEAVFPVKYSEKDLLTLAALSECQSMHPIAQALRAACGIGVHHRDDIQLLEEIPGRGVITLFTGRNVYVGNAAMMMEHDIPFTVTSHAGTVIHVAVDGEYAGHIVLNDKVREGAFDAVEEMRIRGVQSALMLTGDMRSIARPIASSLNFDLVKCELSPEAKVSAMEYLQASKGGQSAIACVSCRSSEAELMSRADVGILFAALGQSAPLDTTDIVIFDEDISRLPRLLVIAKSLELRQKENLIGFFTVKALFLLFGIFGVLNIWVTVLLELIAAVLLLFNAFRR